MRPAEAINTLVGHTTHLVEVALRVTAPTLIACLVAQLTVALVGRAAPAINMFTVALALVLTAGAVVLMATAPIFAREMAGIGRHAAEVMGGVR